MAGEGNAGQKTAGRHWRLGPHGELPIPLSHNRLTLW